MVLVLAAVGALAMSWVIARLLPRPRCADSIVAEGLTLLTGSFLVLVVVFAAVRLPALRYPRETIVSGIIIVAVVWFPFCTHWPPLSRGYARAAMRDMRAIATSLDKFKQRRGSYPIAASIAALNVSADASLPEHDPWGQAYVFRSSADHYALVSYGDCGDPDVDSLDAYHDGPSATKEADIVLRDGVFTTYPSGMPDYRPIRGPQ
jgi:hypothetical protein